jgi:hypothetical protein
MQHIQNSAIYISMFMPLIIATGISLYVYCNCKTILVSLTEYSQISHMITCS